MRTGIRWFGLLLATAALGGLAAPVPYVEALQQPQPQPQPAPTMRAEPQESDRKTSKPYTGDLSIFEDEDRAANLQIDRVMDILGIKEGSGVADIGAGSGWFTVRAARRAGSSGAVYAVDINQEYLDHVAGRAEKEGLPAIRTVLGAEDDPRLPARSVDAVLILKTDHEISKPVTLMGHLRGALRPGALVGIIDRDGKGDDHGVAAETVIAECARAGFELVAQYDFVKADKMDYFLVFRIQASGDRRQASVSEHPLP
jgi:SAM-dependent methyltransferase